MSKTKNNGKSTVRDEKEVSTEEKKRLAEEFYAKCDETEEGRQLIAAILGGAEMEIETEEVHSSRDAVQTNNQASNGNYLKNIEDIHYAPTVSIKTNYGHSDAETKYMISKQKIEDRLKKFATRKVIWIGNHAFTYEGNDVRYARKDGGDLFFDQDVDSLRKFLDV